MLKGPIRPTRSRADKRRALSVWVAGIATLGVVLAFGLLQRPALDRLTNLVFDAYQRLLPRAEAGAPVAVVDIDEASIAELGQWPWPRTTMARLVDRLGEAGAATIAFDIVFPEPDRTSMAAQAELLRQSGASVTLPEGGAVSNDAVFAEAIARNMVTLGIAISNETSAPLPPAIGGFAFGGADPRTYLPSFSGGVSNIPEITGSADGVGSFSFPTAVDGVVRTVPLIFSAQGKLYPSLGLEALRVAQGAGSYVVRSTGASGEADTGRSAMVALRDGALDVPTGPMGDFWIYYSGLASMPTVPAAQVLSGDMAELQAALAGRIVLIGTSAVGLRDIVSVPMGYSTAGVRVHAEIIDQVVGQVFLTRADWAPGAELAAAALLGLVLLFVAGRTGALVTSGVALVLIALAFAGSWWAFAGARLLLDPLLPSLAVALSFLVTTPILLLMSDRERQFVRGAFGRYLSPTLVERLAANPQALALGGEERELTVLFSDIRGFTSLSEKLNPTELTALLNGFLTPMTDILLASEGTIDKYMGDAIMCFWNAPLDIAQHERKACLAALNMVKSLDELNRGREKPLKVGIGLNTAPCCVGNLGSAQRFSYSAIGDGVNVASRVEGQTKAYGVAILVTEPTRAAASDLAFLAVDLVRVVGRAEPLPTHTLVGDAEMAKSPAFQALAADHAEMIAAYRAADPDRAEAALARARAHGSTDVEKLHDLYEERIAEMRADPPPADWDGVFTAKSK
ncbi:MAG: CHASE2 domain-containing protein [Devosia sp.]